MSKFTRAVRKKAKLRLAMTGVSGSGKTYGALRIATGMGGRIAVIDTEHESSSLYANNFEFDSMPLYDFSPEAYISAINDAINEGYDTVIIDSLSHMWVWCKDEAERVAQKIFKGNIWSAWSKVVPRYEALMNCIVQSDIHVICTIRSKTENVSSVVNGKTKIEKVGLKVEMKPEAEFEFTTVIDINHETNCASSAMGKDRTGIFPGYENIAINEGVGVALMEWLNTGVNVLVDENQLNTLNNMMNAIHNAVAIAKIKSAIPDLSKVRADQYEDVASRLKKVIDWQAQEEEKAAAKAITDKQE